MVIIFKIFAKSIVTFLSRINAGRYFVDKLNNAILHEKKTIKHNDLEFKFYVPNRLNFFRINTFSTKEPETLEWIDTFKKKSVFWDIGANIGLYSCYAVKRADCQVNAFEPSVFNLELLAKNVYLNSLSDKVAIIKNGELYDYGNLNIIDPTLIKNVFDVNSKIIVTEKKPILFTYK